MPALRPRLTLQALISATFAVALIGCANPLPQRKDIESRYERKLLQHSLSIDAGQSEALALPQRNIRVREEKTFEVTEFEETRYLKRYTPYQPWRELYEVPMGAVAIVAGLGANVVNLLTLDSLPTSVTRDWLKYGFDGLNPAMNVESNSRAQQSLQRLEQKQLEQRVETLNLPWSERPVGVLIDGYNEQELLTDANGVLPLNLLQEPFASFDFSRARKLTLTITDPLDDTSTQSTLQLDKGLSQTLREAHQLIFDDLEEDEVDEWVYRVQRLKALNLTHEANNLEQSLLALTANDPELQQAFIEALQQSADQ
ncbi:hypothetical protein [Atopomonas sediminilitoris]|uniref:hypothetical protein n=1 Tax=Atopomonas sediminilitoris TaxID=2919919 RepID=UPI001F4D9559|nr:hypothetical protein [Atopomonas sediminilitoris]MCJ8169279.1 hypothetical protein [Atopomonas sediminilitoris]